MSTSSSDKSSVKSLDKDSISHDSKMSGAEAVDLENRDPNGLNAHLGTLHFNDVIGEPDGTHSIDCAYKLSHTCFNLWKGCLYKLLTFYLGCCIAAEWGCEFALIAFTHVWFISPCLKICEINCGLCQRMFANCMNCCCVPYWEAVGTVFHHFKRT